MQIQSLQLHPCDCMVITVDVMGVECNRQLKIFPRTLPIILKLNLIISHLNFSHSISF